MVAWTLGLGGVIAAIHMKRKIVKLGTFMKRITKKNRDVVYNNQ